MHMYKCLGCGKVIKIDLASSGKIICPSCGYRIVEKMRPKVAKKIEAV
jgi:DNA-directed RNA polymerase subunit RPC12/RpoP